MSGRIRVWPLPAPTILALWALWSAVVLALAAAAWALPISHPDGWGPDLMRIAPPLARWDAGWYEQIAREGYHYDPAVRENNVGFYPLYPLLIRLASGGGPSAFSAGIAISVAALLGALLLVARAASDAEEDALPALGALLFYPSSFFLAAAYTESLFLLSTAGAFVAARRGRWAWAGLAGAAAALTRFNGFLILLPLFWIGREEAKRLGRWRPRAVAAIVFSAAGALAFPVYLAARWGDPLLYVHSKTRGWAQHPRPIWSLAVGALREAVARIHEPGAGGKLVFAMMAGSALLFTILTAELFRRRRTAEGLYCAATLLLLFNSGTLDALHRYVLGLFPCFIVFGSWLVRSRPAAAAYAWLGAGTGVLLLARYVHWIFVG
ncbi:MAG TPA: hypothetical protein VFS34_01000 [Thermoanaerobaculia bacterium]|nr:hypothetical protein [Thermoanaerobaculia bacterium]